MNRQTLFVLALLGSLTGHAEDGRVIVDFFMDPLQVGFVVALLFLAIALFAINKTLNVIREMTASQKVANAEATGDESAVEAAKASIPDEKTLMQLLTDAKPVEKEADILLDHDYDGIHELDNNLPPWWLYGFYISMVFAVVYMVRFHISDGPSSAEEFENEMAMAKEEVDAYLATAANLVDESSVVFVEAQSRLDAGKKIFDANCVACHLADGGGLVGPNLTDEYWIHGGGIKNVFSTIKYGVPAKGMISWKDQLNPSQMQDVASYILTLQGTTPANPKEAEGEIWIEETEDRGIQEETPTSEETEVTEESAAVGDL